LGDFFIIKANMIIEQTFSALPPVMRQNILENARAFSTGRHACWFIFLIEHLKQVPLAETNKNMSYF
jgi:hypothetical protein